MKIKHAKLLSLSIDDDGYFSIKVLIKRGKKYIEKIFKGSKAIPIKKRRKNDRN